MLNASISEAMSVNIECMIEFLLKANESLISVNLKEVINTEA